MIERIVVAAASVKNNKFLLTKYALFKNNNSKSICGDNDDRGYRDNSCSEKNNILLNL